MPGSLASAEPRYGFGPKLFTLEFENEADKALYIVGGNHNSRKHRKWFDWLNSQFGTHTDAEWQAHGQVVRRGIRAQAEQRQTSGMLFVPDSGLRKCSPREQVAAHARTARLRQFLEQFKRRKDSGVEQLVARHAHTVKVAGSSPAPGDRKSTRLNSSHSSVSRMPSSA